MTTQLRFEAEAERELGEAAQRYDEQRPGLGRRFLNEVEVTTERIRQFPGAGAPVKHVPADLGVRQAPVKGFPYHIIGVGRHACASESLVVIAMNFFRHTLKHPRQQ